MTERHMRAAEGAETDPIETAGLDELRALRLMTLREHLGLPRPTNRFFEH